MAQEKGYESGTHVPIVMIILEANMMKTYIGRINMTRKKTENEFKYKHWTFDNQESLEKHKDNIDRHGCPGDPSSVEGPIGMYHCPYCGNMVIAGARHPKINPETLEYIIEKIK